MKRYGAILLVVVAALALVVRWRHPRNDAGIIPDASAPSAAAADSALPAPLDHREKRAELRRKILAAWANGEQGEQAAQDAKRGRFEEHPNKDGEGIDPDFIQATMREQLAPMARACFEELLSRNPKSSGRIDMWFKIVADDQLGGIVEDDDEHDGGMITGSLSDEKFQTCIRESLLTVTFPPPAHGGVVTVGYPIIETQNTGDEDAE